MITEAKTRPIIFNSEMIRAILDGRKTQTRRVIKPQPEMHLNIKRNPTKLTMDALQAVGEAALRQEAPKRCPYGIPGDKLWVRETFAERVDIDGKQNPKKARHYMMYRADGSNPQDPNNWHMWTQWKPSIHMPRWASRITLEITDVRVERIQDIRPEEIKLEGANYEKHVKDTAATTSKGFATLMDFILFWDVLNAKRGYPWESNPWVWVIEFRVIENE